jgi:ribonuclease VapC
VILDSSAVIAILLEEPAHARVLDLLAAEPEPAIGAPTLAETAIVLSAKLGVEGGTLLARFLDEFGLVVLPFEEEHWRVATEAYLRYGRGRHPAGLNFGDCLTYAVAWLADEQLLCVGGDFARTDLELAQ